MAVALSTYPAQTEACGGSLACRRTHDTGAALPGMPRQTDPLQRTVQAGQALGTRFLLRIRELKCQQRKSLASVLLEALPSASSHSSDAPGDNAEVEDNVAEDTSSRVLHAVSLLFGHSIHMSIRATTCHETSACNDDLHPLILH